MKPNDIFGQSANDGTVSFEELENAFKTPTQYQGSFDQNDRHSEPHRESPSDFPQNLVNPEGEDVDEPAAGSFDPERSKRTGERIARVIDTGIDFTLSNFVAHNNQTYRADEKDLSDIAECWGEISQEHGWSLGPEWSLVILYLMVYGPLVKQAFTDRRMAEIEERQRKIEARMDAFENQPKNPKTDGTAEPTVTPFTHQPAQD